MSPWLRRAAVRYWPWLYAALFGLAALMAWLSPVSLSSVDWTRTMITLACVCGAGWFGIYRGERRRRIRAEAALDQSSPDVRCQACGHYACNTLDCATCDSLCPGSRWLS